jgi:dUTP pyrophosphatase
MARASRSTLGGRPLAVIPTTVPGGRTLDPMLPVPIVRLDLDLALPSYAHPGDAGLDLRAREDGVVAPAGGRLLMPTGISVAIPVGHAGFVLPRSGNALNHGVTVANAPGLIDAAYRGEIKVVLLNTDPLHPFQVHRGDRIAQLVVQRVEEVVWQEVDSLDGDDRGGGFGHTGKH